ncbi:uncharacterized protein DUF4191 [Saccharopolyspora erythraea NRRL 2338]|uniref:Uncharacterized protein n=2 Tax=Saccharopolyspora erythraea TaxID=1836 RepID=A4FA69_SACEN|nr:DUF4191 domain-containing protein [Saccharopolyspora erythraea]EQD83411.1 membrane protein [Saccharopolyspora erythraea D]PFG94730.1 uncharacterized protein DUF4191 [Saccharopolyspora erythraea NRRL 2338]QRK91452.1 DUF4191 domain-containing protein [Saccharopolyspora erythraea]CAM00944.1 hypothetical protein SACE_1625 [Saccharopolyspora erythraea NRRL 2338]
MAKQDKAAGKEAAKQRRKASRGRVKQIFEAFKMQRREDKLLLPLMIGAFLGVSVVVFLLGLIWGLQWVFLPVGLALGLLAATIVFGRRVQSNVYRKAEGQPGAAGWALENLRGKWNLSQAVAGTTQLDAVHRVIGKPGIVLVGEGAPSRLKPLIQQEKKRIARLVGDTPIYEVLVGTEEGQVPLRKLQTHMMKLPRNINAGQIDALENRLAALASRGNAMPKGPMPQGAKMRNVQRAMRRSSK